MITLTLPDMQQSPLVQEERIAIACGTNAEFVKLVPLYRELVPRFKQDHYRIASAGVLVKNLADCIEQSIATFAPTFKKAADHLVRGGVRWDVKVCQGDELTINQTQRFHGENYIVVNYRRYARLVRVWVLWDAQDYFFTPREPQRNYRRLIMPLARPHIDVVAGETLED